MGLVVLVPCLSNDGAMRERPVGECFDQVSQAGPRGLALRFAGCGKTDDVESLVLSECGHYPAEEAPEAMLSALTAFLAPCRDRRTAADIPTTRGTEA